MPSSASSEPIPPSSEHEYEIRAFVPGVGVAEDPVTGSLNASVAQWLIGAGLAPDCLHGHSGHGDRSRRGHLDLG
jgi:predicted PhzF superfamily epimerase YddE/YHI9